MDKKNISIGFIGQGWLGKHYADEFENRGFSVIRYALEEPYCKNKDVIKNCDIVFIAVPTPTTLDGFDASVVRSVIALVGTGKIAVIRSTIIPGTTDSIQKQYADRIIMHSPEFLTEATAAHDAAYPMRNIIGIPVDSEHYRVAAEKVLEVLPHAPYMKIMPAGEAEMVKYVGNGWLTQKIIFVNVIYDLVNKLGLNYEVIKEALAADPRIGSSHLDPVHASTSGIMGRGAAGHCFLKDFAALRAVYETVLPEDAAGHNILRSIEYKNVQLLTDTKKDLDLVRMVYGEKPFDSFKKI